MEKIISSQSGKKEPTNYLHAKLKGQLHYLPNYYSLNS